ncbi:MAG TPA: sialate O-acetylesterase [Chitinophagaceae bacterium]|nr:sialate O-acetylesterase [Chitinophagaceae bacterium]
MIRSLIFLTIIFSVSCSHKIVADRTTYFPKRIEAMSNSIKKENVWVFIMAGQSNMAGRGIVEPEDTVSDKRILSITKNGQIIIAKEPLHFYEPERTGLDCGLSFAKTLITKIPDSISILIIPTAVGGSSISQWLGDSVYRDVKLFSNFLSKVDIAKQNGIIKGILWHQGESDANEKDIPLYKERLHLLFSKFRSAIGNNELPVLLGELGSFSENPANFNLINKVIHDYAAEDKNSRVISTKELKDKGDHLHFDSKGQRTIGKRFAKAYLDMY